MGIDNDNGFPGAEELFGLGKRFPVSPATAGIKVKDVVAFPFFCPQMQCGALAVPGDDQRGALPSFPGCFLVNASGEEQAAEADHPSPSGP